MAPVIRRRCRPSISFKTYDDIFRRGTDSFPSYERSRLLLLYITAGREKTCASVADAPDPGGMQDGAHVLFYKRKMKLISMYVPGTYDARTKKKKKHPPSSSPPLHVGGTAGRPTDGVARRCFGPPGGAPSVPARRSRRETVGCVRVTLAGMGRHLCTGQRREFRRGGSVRVGMSM